MIFLKFKIRQILSTSLRLLLLFLFIFYSYRGIAQKKEESINSINSFNSYEAWGEQSEEFMHFLDSKGNILMSLKSNGEILGEVKVTLYKELSPISINDCDNNELVNSVSVLDRHWKIEPEFQPINPIEVFLPLTEGDKLNLIGQANSNYNPLDDLGDLGDIILTIYNGPKNIDSSFDNNCFNEDGNQSFVKRFQIDNGLVSSFWPSYVGEEYYISFEVNSLSEFWLHGDNDINSTQVKINNFESDCLNGKTEISWESLNEPQEYRIVLQKSLDGINWFDMYTTGSNETNLKVENYKFIDDTPTSNINYYKLESLNYNGEKLLLGISTSQCLVEFHEIIAYPNPSIDYFFVNINSKKSNNDGEIIINDLNGRIVYQMKIEIVKGNNLFKFKEVGLEKGVFIINISNADQIYKVKKLKTSDI